MLGENYKHTMNVWDWWALFNSFKRQEMVAPDDNIVHILLTEPCMSKFGTATLTTPDINNKTTHTCSLQKYIY